MIECGFLTLTYLPLTPLPLNHMYLSHQSPSTSHVFFPFQSQATGTLAMSYLPPPIPESIRASFDRATWHQYPRWFPTIAILRCFEQMAHNSERLSPDDAESVYKSCKILSGNLESGERRDYGKPIKDGVSVLFYQQQVCKCHATQSSSTSTTKAKDVCHGGPDCVPFIVIVQEKWQRKFASDFVLRIIFMDETHGVNQWRWYLSTMYLSTICLTSPHLTSPHLTSPHLTYILLTHLPLNHVGP